MRRVRGLILDVDGTLVDSNDAHTRAWVAALAEHGLPVPYETVRPLIGMGGDKLLPRAAGIAEDSATGKAVGKRRQEIFKEQHVPRLKPTPGAAEFLRHAHDRGLRLAVASSAKKDELAPLLKICGGESLIEHRTSSDDAENSKPDPDIVQAALERLKLPPGEVVMLGDTPYDVEAATRAGIAIIAVRCGGWDDAGLAGAVAVYDSPGELLAKFDDSPLGRA